MAWPVSTCTPGPAGVRSPIGTRSSPIWRCRARERSTIRASTIRTSFRSRLARGRPSAARSRPGHPEARGAAVLPARPSGADAGAGSFDEDAAARGGQLFNGRAAAPVPCSADLHRAGLERHLPEEIGIDDFQAARSPTAATARRRCAACPPTAAAGSITMVASRPWPRSSTTTTHSSRSASAARRKPISSNISAPSEPRA